LKDVLNVVLKENCFERCFKDILTNVLQKKQFKSSELGQINPPKFEKCEDMANLTFLNDGSVFWNLKTRYQVPE
jgi:myosin heavy subunit